MGNSSQDGFQGHTPLNNQQNQKQKEKQPLSTNLKNKQKLPLPIDMEVQAMLDEQDLYDISVFLPSELSDLKRLKKKYPSLTNQIEKMESLCHDTILEIKNCYRKRKTSK